MTIHKKYCLTEREFQILAGSMGIDQIYGIMPEKTEDMEQKEVYEQMFSMLKKGFLKAEGDKYTLSEELEKLFYTIKEAEYVISVLSLDNTVPVSCIYLADEAVRIEAGGIQGKYLKCSCGGISDITKDLLEELELPQMIEDDILYEKNLLSMDTETIKEWEEVWLAFENRARKDSLMNLKNYGLKTLLEKRTMKDVGLRESISLWEKPICDVLMKQDDEGIRTFCYSKKRFMYLLQEMLGGAEDDFG